MAWLKAQAAKFSGGDLNLTDASHHYAAIAVQGPKVRSFINACIPGASDAVVPVAAVSDLKKNQLAGFQFENHNVLVACTGYTGEDGFEILGPEAAAGRLWDKLLSVGAPFGIKPCGLGARDTLRTEVCYPLYGHELDEHTTPIEAGVGFFVSLDKGRIQRPRRARGAKGEWREEKTGRVQDDGQIRAAAPALSNLGERREPSASSPAARKARRSTLASAWAMSRRNLPRPARKSRLKFAANASPPSWCRNRSSKNSNSCPLAFQSRGLRWQ